MYMGGKRDLKYSGFAPNNKQRISFGFNDFKVGDKQQVAERTKRSLSEKDLICLHEEQPTSSPVILHCIQYVVSL